MVRPHSSDLLSLIAKIVMKWFLFLCTALMALSSFPGPAWVEGNQEIFANGPRIEKYRYQAFAIGSEAVQKEIIEMEFRVSDRSVEYISKAISSEGIEEITIHMDSQGRFISGIRSMANHLERQVRQERVWRADHRVYVDDNPEKGKKKKEYELPQGSGLAVDGSLLVLLRSFPFNEDKEWNIFMVDFSGYSVTVTVRQAGMEKISVPGGEFECYRVEVVVNIPILRPKIIYWISKIRPHFLVKHQGKRGPFTSTYLTSLLSFE